MTTTTMMLLISIKECTRKTVETCVGVLFCSRAIIEHFNAVLKNILSLKNFEKMPTFHSYFFILPSNFFKENILKLIILVITRFFRW